jgi:hypothetical protein
VDFKEQIKPIQVDWKDQILALPIATDVNGDTLFHCLEWAKKENIVVVYDMEARGWMRGKGNKRYRVKPMYSDSAAPFTILKSGRNDR